MYNVRKSELYKSHVFESQGPPLYILWIQNLVDVTIGCGVSHTDTKCTQLVHCNNIISIHIKYLSITLSPLCVQLRIRCSVRNLVVCIPYAVGPWS
jgi:hypothetical protein